MIWHALPFDTRLALTHCLQHDFNQRNASSCDLHGDQCPCCQSILIVLGAQTVGFATRAMLEERHGVPDIMDVMPYIEECGCRHQCMSTDHRVVD